jgi:hypothetical protein
MYFTSLPDHNRPGFDKQLHFNSFKKQNIVFNALASSSHCQNHVGCLSFKAAYNVQPHHFRIISYSKLSISAQFRLLPASIFATVDLNKMIAN